MAKSEVTDDEFEIIWLDSNCSPQTVSEELKIALRNVYARRERMEKKGYSLPSICRSPGSSRQAWHYSRCVNVRLEGASILIGGDAHKWPGSPLPIWQAFCAVAEEVKPDTVVINGDQIDGARISRHGRSPGQTPSLAEEIAATREDFALLPPSPRRFWTMGNHDARVDTYLATHAPEMEDYAGSLVDRFTDWSFAWSVMINDSIVIRHRFRSGIHAGWNSSLHAGLTTVTNHTHQLECKPVVDMRGTRYGIETGMLGDPMGPQFQYGEGSPNRHRAGFVLLTFDSAGDLLPPELCEWRNGAAWFRGKTWAAKPRVRVQAGRAA